MRNLFKLFFAIMLFLFVTACAPTRAIHEGVNDAGPSVKVTQQIPESEKMVVAIARFSNETHYGSGLFVDKDGDRIGKQASDSLARHLLETQRFKVMERPDLGKLKAEAKLMGKTEDEFQKELKAVNALILGSVVELGRETTGSSWLFGKSKEQRVRARVIIRLVEPVSGEVFYTSEGSGDATLSTTNTLGFGGQAGFDSTLEGKAIDAAIVNMMNKVITTLNARSQKMK